MKAVEAAATQRAMWVDFSTLVELLTESYALGRPAPMDRLRKQKVETAPTYKKQQRYLRNFLETLKPSEAPMVYQEEVPSAELRIGPRKPVVWVSPNREARRFHVGRILELMHSKERK